MNMVNMAKLVGWIVTALTVFFISAFQIFQTKAEAEKDFIYSKEIKSDLCQRLDKLETKIDSVLNILIFGEAKK